MVGAVNNEFQVTTTSTTNGATFVGIVTKSGRQNATTRWSLYQSNIVTLKDNAMLQLMANIKERQIRDQHKSFKSQSN